MKKILIMTMVAFLAGCSATSKIEKANESESHFKGAVYEGRDFYKIDKEVKGERYRVFHQASTGFTGTAGIRSSAERRANAFCDKENKKMLTISEHTAKPPYILGNFPRIEIIFVCINKSHSKNSNNNSKYEELKKIKNLLNEGILTKEEYIIEKKKVLLRDY
jgi:hypothetical protein